MRACIYNKNMRVDSDKAFFGHFGGPQSFTTYLQTYI